VLGLLEKITNLEPRMTCQALYLLVKATKTIELIFFFITVWCIGHMGDRGLKGHFVWKLGLVMVEDLCLIS
jgi:hypothetical protein